MANLAPFELRRKAFYQLHVAKALIEDYPDAAAYNGGYAVELMLKARICRLQSWSDWSSTRRETEARLQAENDCSVNDIFAHDVDRLLSVSETENLDRSSFSHIDWDLVADCS